MFSPITLVIFSREIILFTQESEKVKILTHSVIDIYEAILVVAGG